ncbi:MAG: hypothetical protein V1651_03465 [Patescibacteria group bacterium]
MKINLQILEEDIICDAKFFSRSSEMSLLPVPIIIQDWITPNNFLPQCKTNFIMPLLV